MMWRCIHVCACGGTVIYCKLLASALVSGLEQYGAMNKIIHIDVDDNNNTES
jgi:hypothetical protein